MSDEKTSTIQEALAGHEFEDGVGDGQLVADAIVILRVIDQDTGAEAMQMAVTVGQSTIIQQGLLHMVDHPAHYTGHPSGVECIQITEHMGFCLGNAVKYIWRAGLKSANPIQDLRKARWYIDREIARLEARQ